MIDSINSSISNDVLDRNRDNLINRNNRLIKLLSLPREVIAPIRPYLQG